MAYSSISLKSNNAKEGVSLFDGKWHHLIILVSLIAVFVLVRLIFDLITNEEVRHRKHYLLPGYIVLGLTFVLAGIGSSSHIAKDMLFGLVEFLALFGAYFLCVYLIEWKSFKKDYVLWLLLFYGLAISAEVIVSVASKPWTKYTFTLGPGNHLLDWKYGNQLALEGYENSFYIDDITVGNAYDIYRANCDGTDMTLIADDETTPYFTDNDWVTLPIGQYKYGVCINNGSSIYWSECIDKDYQGLDENVIADVAVYPNPAHDYIRVETQNCAFLQRIDVYNVTGQLVISSTETEINVSELESGVYFVNILTEKGVFVKKITVSR